ncbi:heavy-metal-associated domain-containing protein [Micromonospora echinaurantiaca]|uniref:heavy-metal-associated domain-containing protein n=1 Tax=Micromonospora echinaurantiaca TaxID=47857 RepID=UPI003792A41B
MCASGSSCGCATVSIDKAPAPPTEAGSNVRTTYTVSGMTCGGCAKTVTRHVSAIAGVTGVQIDVASGAVTVASEGPVSDADMRAAVEQAGYRLVG